MTRNALSPRHSHLLSLAAAACCALLLWSASVARADDGREPISSEARIDYNDLAANMTAGRITPATVIALYGKNCYVRRQGYVWELDDVSFRDGRFGFRLELDFDIHSGFLIGAAVTADLEEERQTGFHLRQAGQ